MPVRFDDAAADRLQQQLETTAGALRETAARFEQEVFRATQDWRGRFRQVFDVRSQERDHELRTLADELHFMAACVRARQLEAQALRQAEARALAEAEAAAAAEAERQRQAEATMTPTGTVPR